MLLSPMEMAQICHEQNRTYAAAIKARWDLEPWADLEPSVKLACEAKVRAIMNGTHKENALPPIDSVHRIMEALAEGMVHTLMEIM